MNDHTPDESGERVSDVMLQVLIDMKDGAHAGSFIDMERRALRELQFRRNHQEIEDIWETFGWNRSTDTRTEVDAAPPADSREREEAIEQCAKVADALREIVEIGSNAMPDPDDIEKRMDQMLDVANAALAEITKN